jgi:nucleotide-binding universal stress UspA family protein
MKIQTIAVPTDFSEHAAKAYAKAIQFAKVFGSRIDLLHVYDIPDLASVYEIAFPDQEDAGIRKAALGKLEAWNAQGAAEGVGICIHLEFGAPGREHCGTRD